MDNNFSLYLQENILTIFLLITLIPLLFVLIFDYFNFKRNNVQKVIRKRFKEEKYNNKIEIYQEQFEGLFSKKKKEIEEKLEKSEVKLTVKEYMFIMMISMASGAAIGFLITPFGFVFEVILRFIDNPAVRLLFIKILASAVYGYLGYFVPNIWMKILSYRREKLLSEQVEDFLIALYENKIAGMNDSEALRNAGKDLPYPMGDEVSLAYEEYISGKRFIDALETLKNRVNNKDMFLAITSMQIQFETGGELSSILRNIISIISERQVLKKEVEKSVASSKFTAYTMLAAPFVFISLISISNKDVYASMLERPLGIFILLIGAGLYVIGAICIFNILNRIRKITI